MSISWIQCCCSIAVLANVIAGIADAQEASITVNWPNALEMVSEQLGRRYGWGISYEGPDYEYPGDLVNVKKMARPMLEDIQNCSTDSLIVARYCYFTATYPVDPITHEPTNAMATVREIVEQYNRGPNPGRFAVIETQAGLCIVPTAVKNIVGEWKPAEPLLSRPISVVISNATSVEALAIVIRAIKGLTESPVYAHSFRDDRRESGAITLQAENEPARDVLARLYAHPAFGETNDIWYFNRHFTCPPSYKFEDDGTEKGVPYSPPIRYPEALIGNVTHPDYRAEGAAPVASPDDALPPVVPRQSSGR